MGLSKNPCSRLAASTASLSVGRSLSKQEGLSRVRFLAGLFVTSSHQRLASTRLGGESLGREKRRSGDRFRPEITRHYATSRYLLHCSNLVWDLLSATCPRRGELRITPSNARCRTLP